MSSLKETIILNYMASVDFKKDWSYELIEQDLAKSLGERPSMEVKYTKDVMILEGSKQAKEIKILDEVSIIYTDLDNKIKKLKITIN